MVPYFQLGQHIRNSRLLDTIVLYLSALPNEFNFSLNTSPTKIGSVINKRTNVRVLSINSVDTLYDYLAYFLLSMPFQTRKKVDFLFWCVALHMHKLGYFYSARGRAMVLAIANFINHRRYSSAPTPATEPVIDRDFLLSNLPITLAPEMNHNALAKAFARLIVDRVVYVYDYGKLLAGSPFTTYPYALIAIGESKRSALIKRNIDTGKVSKKRYTFYSVKQ